MEIEYVDVTGSPARRRKKDGIAYSLPNVDVRVKYARGETPMSTAQGADLRTILGRLNLNMLGHGKQAVQVRVPPATAWDICGPHLDLEKLGRYVLQQVEEGIEQL